MKYVHLIALVVSALLLIGCGTTVVTVAPDKYLSVAASGPAPFCDVKCAKSRALHAAKAACDGNGDATEVFPSLPKPAAENFLEVIKTTATAVGALKGIFSLFGSNAYSSHYKCR